MSSTPTFEQVLTTAIESKLIDLHTAMPGVVESYDPTKQTISVVPALKRKYESGEVVTRPLINNVPVCFPRGGSFSITHPLKKGDSVLLVISERSLDVWKKNGGTVDPNDPRKFNLTDAFAIPGGYPQTNVVAGATADKIRILNKDTMIEMSEADIKISNPTTKVELVGGKALVENATAKVELDAGKAKVENAGASFELTAAGKIVLKKIGGDDVLDLLSQTLAGLIAATTNVLGVETPLTNVATFVTLKAKIDAIKGP